MKDGISKPAVVSGEVLLLTPYEDEREMYDVSLTSAGFHVTCDHPDRGHVLARRLIPNVIVKRTRPGDSGLTVAKAIRNDPVTAQIPVVIITTYTDALRREAAEEIGVAGYFLLPLSPDELVAIVRRVLARGPC